MQHCACLLFNFRLCAVKLFYTNKVTCIACRDDTLFSQIKSNAKNDKGKIERCKKEQVAFFYFSV